MSNQHHQRRSNDSENPFTVDPSRKLVLKTATFVAIIGTVAAGVAYAVTLRHDVTDVQRDVKELKYIVTDQIQAKVNTDHEFMIRQEGVNQNIIGKLDYIVNPRGKSQPATGFPSAP